MTDNEVQRKLNQLTRLTNEIDAEAKRRYGQDGNLFFEAEGTFHIMAGDSDDGPAERQKFIRFTSAGNSQLGAGAW